MTFIKVNSLVKAQKTTKKYGFLFLNYQSITTFLIWVNFLAFVYLEWYTEVVINNMVTKIILRGEKNG